MAAEDGYLTPTDVGRRVGCSVKTVYRAIRRGELEAWQPTARYLITPAAYEAWVSRQPKHRVQPDRAGAVELPGPMAPSERGSREELRSIEREAA